MPAVKHSDQTRFIVAVLFLHGASESEIGGALRQFKVAWLTKGQVAGIINRAGDGALRGLDKAGRQEWLDRLKAHRGSSDPTALLKDAHFIAREQSPTARPPGRRTRSGHAGTASR